MESIQADIAGLSELGASCSHHAGQLCAAGEAPPAGGSFQASSAAVAGVHADADATEILFASRLLSTGYTVVQAASSFVASDDTNASLIGGIADAVTV
ncbi:MAG TPA: hypothetical protein VH185_09055 [Mycobacterium sp.]|jgi:hypothetical protein|nr:hypothetical protein [Mycobacterium sp.]